MRICHVAAELAPLAKTGGLGDVVAALSAQLSRDGHDVRVFLPLHGQMDLSGRALHRVDFLSGVPVWLGQREVTFDVFTTPLPGTDGFDLYLVDCPELFHRPRLYEFDDEHVRFALLARAALETCQRMGWAPEIVHAHDWHAALVPLYLRTRYAWDRLFHDARTVLTIHNLGYQGVFPSDVLRDLDLHEHAELLHQEDLAAGRVNFLKTGILYADVLTTVSATYAREIQTPEYGFGLDPLLRRRADHLVGIVNGIDAGEWDPSDDPMIPHAFSPDDLSGKAANRTALRRELGLPNPPAPGPMLIGIVSRLVHQKGFHLTAGPLAEALAANRAQLVVLGTGEARYETMFRQAEERFPGRARFVNEYDHALAHRIEAGADAFVMPSLYEPCGLNQMYSLRYGTPPVVRRTGGLADTVEPWNGTAGTGTGFVFEHADVPGFRWALGQALEVWESSPAGWLRLQRNAMARDFSWQRQAGRYVELYRRLHG
jgi:starch synthase